MTAPLIPFIRTVSTPLVYSFRKGYRQAAPHNVVTPFEGHFATLSNYGLNWADAAEASGIYFESLDDSIANALVSDCYEKLKAKLSDRAQLGASLGELNESLAMIQKRVIPLTRAIRYLRKGQFHLAGSALGLDSRKLKKPTKGRDFVANSWLELHLGWVPMVTDIQSAVDVLQSPIKSTFPKAGSAGPEETLILIPEVNISKPPLTGWCGGSYQTYHEFDRFNGSRSVFMGAEVSVDNPNLWLANQLGFVSLPGIIWELTPLSFVADWFVNIGQFLSQGTDFLGLTLDKTYTSKIMRGVRTRKLETTCIYWNDGVKTSRNYSFQNIRIVDFKRGTGIDKPGLFVRPFKLFGWQRAATAVSLLNGLLGKVLR